jgi:acyl-coenzyme A thioesterase PaaI-like protein
MELPPTIGTALQDVWPAATCYGCGPANQDGLQIKSYWSANYSSVVCTHHPAAKYNAGFENVMYGGLVASLIDCHSIWAAIADTYRREGRPHGELPAISYVTGQLDVRYLKPTPLDHPILLQARIESVDGRKTRISCQLGYADAITAEAQVLGVRITDDKSLGAQQHKP